LRLAQRDKVPDHSWLSKTRSRLPHEVHEQVFGWVLNLVAERGLVKGERIGIDASTRPRVAAIQVEQVESDTPIKHLAQMLAHERGAEAFMYYRERPAIVQANQRAMFKDIVEAGRFRSPPVRLAVFVRSFQLSRRALFHKKSASARSQPSDDAPEGNVGCFELAPHFAR
jgi:hypothetical protein